MTWEQEHNQKIYLKYAHSEHVKTVWHVLMVLTIFVPLYLLLVAWVHPGVLKEVVRCSDFQTRQEAQVKYLSDPVHYGNLDANHDGVACNNLPLK